MKIDNEFTVGVPIDRAWRVLTDLEGIAPCLPGAQLTGVKGDTYSGKVKIKVGPVVSEYAGTAQFTEKDASAYRAVIDARGKDSRGAGTASAAIHAQLRADGGRTVVTVNTDLNITGKIAQFGSGMIKEVSAKLLGQFVRNLEAKLLIPVETSLPDAEAIPVLDATASAKAQVTRPKAEVAPVPVGAETATPLRRQPEPEPLDLMSLAGRSIYKRLIPLVVGIVIVIGLIVYFVAR
jgi:uncharacterized protein